MRKNEVVNTVMMALCELGVGILLLVDPIGLTRWIFIALGIVLVVMGALETITYFRTEPGMAFGKYLATGMAEIAAGWFCMFQYGWFIVTFPLLTILYGILILLTGFFKVQWTVDMIRLKQEKWYLAAASALLSLAFAWVILSNPFASTAALWMFVAISLIVEAFVDVFVLLFRKKLPEQRGPAV